MPFESHFTGKEPHIRRMYEALLTEVQAFGPVRVSSTKNALLLASKTTFMAIKTKRSTMDVEFLLDRAETDFPIYKTVTVSKNRYAHFIRLDSEEQLNGSLLTYLREAFDTVNR